MSFVGSNIIAGASGSQGAAGYKIDRSLRFNSSDSAYLSKNFGSAGNRKTWTWAGWVKRGQLGGSQGVFTSGTSNANLNPIYFGYDYADTVAVLYYNGNFEYRVETTAVFRDPSAWYHVLIAYDSTQAVASDRIKIYVNGTRQTSFATASYPAQNLDGWINASDTHAVGAAYATPATLYSGYLADIHFIDGQALAPTDFGEYDDNGVWQPVEYSGTYGTNGFHLDFSDNSSAAALGTDTSGNGNDWTPNNFSVINNTQRWSRYFSVVGSGSSNVNGTELQAFDSDISTFNGYSGALLPSNYLLWSSPVTFTNAAVRVRVNQGNLGTGTLEVNGVSRTITNAQGVHWEDFGTLATFNSIKLGLDSQPSNGTYIYAVEVNGSVLVDSVFNYGNDSLVDTPTNYGTDTGAGGEVVGNYCTLNPLAKGPNTTLSNGNLEQTTSASGGSLLGTFGMSSGKWYWEATNGTTGGAYGIALSDIDLANYPGQQAKAWSYVYNGNKYNNGTGTSYGSTFTTNDVIGVAFDADNGTLTFYKNGVSQGTAFTGLTSGPYLPLLGASSSSSIANFGQRPFAYTAPSGFKALCTTNLDDPLVAKPSEVMDVVTYTANASTQVISGLGFSPDLVWTKSRTGAWSHYVYDSVRGTNKPLVTNATSAEGAQTNALTAYNSDGFTLGTQDGSNYVSGQAGVAWTWDAGSSTVTNTDGSITSSVRANTTAGFSVATWTGSGSGSVTVGHGLGVAPRFMIVKDRSLARNWLVYHASLGASSGVALNSTSAASGADSGWWNNTAPTSAVATIGTYGNESSNYVGYFFAPVDGYSSAFSYTGNGSADGPMVYLGFRPRFIIQKRTDAAGSWLLIDTARDPVNVARNELFANSSAAEYDNTSLLDVLSNGFKIRATFANMNASGGSFIGYAFAENPFKTARAR